MNHKKLATFRIDVSQWQAFQEWAKRSGTNASALLVDYIEQCLDRPPTRVTKFRLAPKYNTDKRIDSIDKKLEQLEISIEKQISESIATRMPELSANREENSS
ncbi:hypothetical protein [Floridanema evergladense]|uniref:Uncharacterized protein n=1 Tax=Floridaenema evergladense BLCC-F167 TaxID=3153639 RepID=A0ABV4WJV4_9CYAN